VKLGFWHQGRIVYLKRVENKVLKRIFVPKRGEVTGGWRKLHNEELPDPLLFTIIIRIIKSRRMS
jgi:hypothetical protein